MHPSISRLGRTGAALAAAAALGLSLAAPASAADEPRNARPFTAMTQNLYLGADITAALSLLPDFRALSQALWDEVAATDFTARAPQLAAQAGEYAPDVIGLQEATTWRCQKNLFSTPVDIYNFTEQYLAALDDAGTPYVVAAKDGQQAFNPGYAINPIPGVTVVNDPDTFQPIFGQDTASCGVVFADALLVRADLADQVTAVGTGDYDEKAVIGGVITIDRGYAWADVTVSGFDTRFVTTHLESVWTEDEVTPGSIQSRQLASDLAEVTKPLVVMGDFNADPRDPRPVGALNPGEQVTASDACPAQTADPTVTTADSTCNAYWVMRQAGYTDVGPDAFDPMNYTWGSMSELAGPAASRVEAALALGNPYGFTDRLDYIFVKNGAKAKSKNAAQIIGNVWPYGTYNWECTNTELQVSNTEAMSQVLTDAGVIAAPVLGTGVCFPTDHAGIVSELRIVPGKAKQ